jgi:hypothetical protein
MVSEDGIPIFIETPFLVPLRTGTAMFGAPVIYMDQRDVPLPPHPRIASMPDSGAPDPFVAGLLRVGGRLLAIPLPDGVERMDTPRAVVIDSIAHLIWKIPDETGTPGRQWLLHATFDGTRWSVADTILTAPEIWWTRSHTSSEPVVVGREIHMIVRVRGAKNEDLAYLRRTESGWTASLSGIPDFVAYVSLGVAPSRELILSYVAGTSDVGRHGMGANTVFVAYSADGTSWSRGERLSPVGSGPAYDAALTVLDSVQAITWVQRTPTDSASVSISDSIQLSWRTPLDTAWRRTPALAVPQGTRGLRTTVASNGILYLIMQDIEKQALLVGTWKHGAWTSLDTLAASLAPTPAGIAMIGDSIHVVWGDQIPSPRGGHRPVGYIASRALNCSREAPAARKLPLQPPR